MKWLMVIFVLVATAMLVLAHLVLYASWLVFLDITFLTGQNVLLGVLLFLSLSFTLTTILVHWRENQFTSWAYFLAASWIGILWHFMFASVLLWIMWGFREWFPWNIDMRTLAYVLYGMALMLSAYAFWAAQFPRVKKITIRIKDLPDAWEGRRAVQLSDVHLGAIHHIRFARRIVERIKAVSPDIVFITGDLFDGAGRELGLLAQPFKDLNPRWGQYLVMGNHETYIGLDIVFRALEGLPLTVLRNEIREVEGVQIMGFEYPSQGASHDIAPMMKGYDPRKPAIVLHHEPRISSLDKLKKSGVDLVLSGHTHRGQLWPFGLITQAVYKQYDRGLHRDGTFSQYTSIGVGTWAAPMRTGYRSEIVEITFMKY